MLGFYQEIDYTNEQPLEAGHYYVADAFQPFPWETEEMGTLRRVRYYDPIKGFGDTPPQRWFKKLTDPVYGDGEVKISVPRMYVLPDILSECDRQIKKWGDQSFRSLFEWQSILNEEVGEAAKAVNEYGFTSRRDPEEDRLFKLATAYELREELVQVAAVAMSFIHAVDVKIREIMPDTGDNNKEP